MKIYGLIGKTLIHSFSQKYFTEKFQKENIPGCQYRNFEIKNPEHEISLLKKMEGLAGLNVTIPYKKEIIFYCDLLSFECQQIQATNCIRIKDGMWTAFNTDIIGFERSFYPSLKPHQKKALILGTGGASEAVAFVLKKLDIPYLFVSRKSANSGRSIGYNKIDKQILEEYPVVINTTPLGMYPDINTFPALPYQFVSEKNYFFDLVYNPQKTIFLAKAEEMGATIKNGEEMLVIQAEESWRIWNS